MGILKKSYMEGNYMKKDIFDLAGWDSFVFETSKEVIDLIKHINDDQKNHLWLSRGQNLCWKKLLPGIDREPYSQIRSRSDKLALERACIDQFKTTAFIGASKRERRELTYDIGALMVLQHYGGFTRLLDWSTDPFVSTYFAVDDNDDKDSELWFFEYQKYLELGAEQWSNYPNIDKDCSILVRYQQLFKPTAPKPYFFMCIFDYLQFDRIESQSGFFSITSSFNIDHAKAISTLFNGERDKYCRYIIKGEFKAEIRKVLKDQYNIWDGVLFPDTAGAAESVKRQFIKNANRVISKLS